MLCSAVGFGFSGNQTRHHAYATFTTAQYPFFDSRFFDTAVRKVRSARTIADAFGMAAFVAVWHSKHDDLFQFVYVCIARDYARDWDIKCGDLSVSHQLFERALVGQKDYLEYLGGFVDGISGRYDGDLSTTCQCACHHLRDWAIKYQRVELLFGDGLLPKSGLDITAFEYQWLASTFWGFRAITVYLFCV